MRRGSAEPIRASRKKTPHRKAGYKTAICLPVTPKSVLAFREASIQSRMMSACCRSLFRVWMSRKRSARLRSAQCSRGCPGAVLAPGGARRTTRSGDIPEKSGDKGICPGVGSSGCDRGGDIGFTCPLPHEHGPRFGDRARGQHREQAGSIGIVLRPDSDCTGLPGIRQSRRSDYAVQAYKLAKNKFPLWKPFAFSYLTLDCTDSLKLSALTVPGRRVIMWRWGPQGRTSPGVDEPGG